MLALNLKEYPNKDSHEYREFESHEFESHEFERSELTYLSDEKFSIGVPVLALKTATLASAASLAACGGGGGDATTGGVTPTPTPTPSPTPAISSARAAQFLQQAQFSASDADIAAVQSLGINAWLAQQMALPLDQTGWDWLLSQGYNTTAFVNTVAIADYMVWHDLITCPDPLRKRVALALSEFMVVSSNGVPIASRGFAMAQYWDTLVANAFGNFRSLLSAISLNPAMGVYLNMKGNQKANAASGRAPDENYARELMQLFTIGLYQLNIDGSQRLDASGKPIETYSNTDVSQLARVLTGWDYDTAGSTVANPTAVRKPMVVNPSLHETAASTFLGTTIAAGLSGQAALDAALDALFNHANVAPFFAKQMIQRMVASNPSAAYVARVAAVFNNNGAGVRGDLKAVFTAILTDADLSSAAITQQATWGKQREPIVRLVQWARSFGATSTPNAAGFSWVVGDLSDMGTRLGQSPLRSPSVFNFFRPGYVPPNTALAAQALVAPEFQLTNESTVAGYINFMNGVIKNGFNAANGGLAPPPYTVELGLTSDPAALVAKLNRQLAGGALSAATVATIQTAVASIAATTLSGQQNRVYAAILLVMACPEYLIQK